MFRLKQLVMSFYAVRVGKTPGIFNTWPECQEQVIGFAGAKFKKFKTRAEAENFIQDGKGSALHETTKTLILKSKKSPLMNKKRLVESVVNAAHSNRIPFISDTNPIEELDISEPKPVVDALQFKRITSKSKTTKPAVQKKTILIETPGTLNDKNLSTVKEYTTFPQSAVVYTDGSCINNGKKTGVSGGIGVYWGPGHHMNVSEKLLVDNPTNQKAELTAAIYAIRGAKKMNLASVEVRTDSNYTIKSMTDWMVSRTDPWKTSTGKEILNIDLVKELDSLCKQVAVTWVHVPAHTGNYGNEQADKLARSAAERVDNNDTLTEQ